MSPPRGVRWGGEHFRIVDCIDHTLLKAEAVAPDIDKLCDEALQHGFAAVCVNPMWVERCVGRLRGSQVAIATVVGFPLGANESRVKAYEAASTLELGATEIDMVIALGSAKRGDWDYVRRDIAAVVDAASGALVKVIIESAALTSDEVTHASEAGRDGGAHYLKTSTGFHATGGATLEAVRAMRRVAGDSMGVKASGGVRDCATALAMIAAGATRIGTSNGVSMAECTGQGPMPTSKLTR